MEKTACSETSAYKIQTPGNYLEENIQHTERGESLKSRRELLPYVNFKLALFKFIPPLNILTVPNWLTV